MKRIKDISLKINSSSRNSNERLVRDNDGCSRADVCIDGIMYTLVDRLKRTGDNKEPLQIQEAQVKGATDSEVESLTIPETVEYEGITFPVRRIGVLAFHNYVQLRYIQFPETLQVIDMAAFQGCENLERVVLPDGFKRMAFGAFSFCENLKEISVKRQSEISVGESVFKGCNENFIVIERDEE